MKVYIIADIEGMAGVVFYCHTRGSHLAHDIEMRMELGTLHPDLDQTVDAVVLLGMHPKAGTRRGGTPHSLIYVRTDRGAEYFLSEATNSAAFAGSYGVPAVLVTGDRAVCEDTAQLIPGIETVVTKSHYASQLARTKSPLRVRGEIEAATARALQHIDAVRPLSIEGKCRVQIADRNPDRRWPAEAKEYPDFRSALMETLRDVPWYKPVTAIDDGWRYPDAREPGAVVSEWN